MFNLDGAPSKAYEQINEWNLWLIDVNHFIYIYLVTKSKVIRKKSSSCHLNVELQGWSIKRKIL